ncbi:c-type cytochrome biogenesis protein CcsB [Aquipuribacter nitratireducens]|uniref:C-type cytochrome biogenesis protein CcsB n=1 Tax=Aquipuribacter nitratireducens TaxID=650104 RepID=A0ABW0GRC9_9MICO
MTDVLQALTGLAPTALLGTGSPVDEGWAGASDAATYSAMAVYAGSLVAYAVDLAGSRRVSRVRERRGAEVREAVPAGAPTVPSDVSGAGTGGDTTAGPAVRRGRAGGIGTSLFVLATLLHLVAVVARGVAVSRVPWSDAYEFALSGSLAVSLVYLVLLRTGGWRWLGSFVVFPVLLTLMVATSFFYTEASALSPALQSSWLVVHVSIAFVASALFTIGFSLAVVQLAQHRQEAAVAAGATPGRFLAHVPSARRLEQTSFQLHAVGFVLWTFTVVGGAIWAAEAWGRYWGWDPKEVWSLVIWVVYAAYLHARSTAGWAGTRSAWIAVLGFACLLFNFFGVNYLFVGNHSYAL